MTPQELTQIKTKIIQEIAHLKEQIIQLEAITQPIAPDCSLGRLMIRPESIRCIACATAFQRG